MYSIPLIYLSAVLGKVSELFFSRRTYKEIIARLNEVYGIQRRSVIIVRLYCIISGPNIKPIFNLYLFHPN